MDDKRLTQEAVKYHIKTEDYETDEAIQLSWKFFPRDYIIASLVGRDQALRTRWVIVISIVSLLISLAALVLSIRK